MQTTTFDDAARLKVATALRARSQQKNLLQRDLAKTLGLSEGTISKIWGAKIKKPKHYQALAAALGTSIEEILTAELLAQAERSAEVITLPSASARQSTRPCQVITIAARKGGATKTTTTVHLSGALARAGWRVLLIDLDGQRDSTEWLLDPALAELDGRPTADDVLRHGADPLPAILPSIIDGLDILPASPEMDAIESAMAGQWGMERRLDGLLEEVRPLYDFVLFDCPAAMDFRIVSALMSSDWVLIPTTASTLDLKGLISFIPRVLHFADPQRFNPRLKFLGILVSRVKRNTLLAREARQWLGEEFEDLLFEHVVHESTRYQELAGYQALIYEHDPEWAKDYEGVADEILERVGFFEEEQAKVSPHKGGHGS